MITDQDVRDALKTYLLRCPEDREQLAEPIRLIESGSAMTGRSCLPAHATASALVLDGRGRLLVVHHLVYGLELQPGGHLEPGDIDLPGAALRELTEETGIDPDLVELAAPEPGYVIYHHVPRSEAKGEAAHHHLDFGFLFTSDHPRIGAIDTAEVASATWRPRAELPMFLAQRLAHAIPLRMTSTACGYAISGRDR